MKSSKRTCGILGAVAFVVVLCVCGACALISFLGLPPSVRLPDLSQPTPSLAPGVLFDDDFSSEQASRNKGWTIFASDNTDILWSPKKLTIAVKKKDYGQFNWPDQTFKDFGVEVEAEPASDSRTMYARYGILFGIANESAEEMYDFGVSTTGQYSLVKVKDGKIVKPLLVDFTPSSCIQARPGKNRMGVLVEGSKISLYINGYLVSTVSDNSIQGGYVGIHAQSGASERAEVSFTRMTIWSVEKAKAEWSGRAACKLTPPASGIWLQDDFSSQQASMDRGWVLETTSERDVSWSPNKYIIAPKQKGNREMSFPVGLFDNFGVEIEAQPEAGSGLEYGIVFRLNVKGDVSSHYRFGITTYKGESYYSVGKEIDGKVVEPGLVGVRPSSHIKTGSKNRMGVLAQGTTLTFYINGHMVKTITDEAISGGKVGIFALDLVGDGARVSFNRVTIYTVDKAKAEWGAPPTAMPSLLYQADFNSKQALEDDGWQVTSGNAADQVWSAGRLTTVVKVKNYLYVNGPNYETFKDFGVEIEAVPESDPSFSYGILFRESNLGRERPSYYVFAVTPNGMYMLRRQSEGKFADPDPVDFTSSSYIKQGAVKNRLGVLAEGTTISLFINGNRVKTISGDAPLSGKVEVFILSGSKERTQVDFSRMTIYTVAEAKKTWSVTTTLTPEPTRAPGILFNDDFSSKQKSQDLGWTLGSFDVQERTWSPNQLNVTVKKKGAWDIALAGPPYNDFGVEIEAQSEDKPGIQYGVVFRYSFKEDSATRSSLSSFYLFAVSNQGEYSVLKMVNGKWVDQDLVPATPSTYIKKGSAKNRVGVLVEKSSISLYINGNLVKTLTDDSLTWGGVGTFAFSGSNEQAQVSFSRVTVYTAERAKSELSKR